MRNHTFILIVLAGFLFYLVNSATDDNTNSEPGIEGSRIDQDFDYYMTSVDSTQFNITDCRQTGSCIIHRPNTPSLTRPAWFFMKDRPGHGS